MEMTFLNGFFLVNFLPFGIIILAGIMLFFKGNYKQERFYYPLLFIIIVLIIIAIWRIPVLIDRRYAMPTIVPGIVISAFLLMEFPDILKKFKIPYAKTITRVLIAILLIACAAKALRAQTSKTYLYEMAEALNKSCQNGNQKEEVLFIFGNPGGHLPGLNDKTKLINVRKRNLNDRLADLDYQFGVLDEISDPYALKIRYPRLYLLCVEEAPGIFSSAWRKRYGDQLELIYEYIRPKDQICYRLYRALLQNRKTVIWNSNADVKLSGGIDFFTTKDQIKTYTVKKSKRILSADFIPVEAGKVYQLSGEFRSVGAEPSMIYFGYAPFTENKKNISIESVNYINNTETELVKSCKSEDKILYVKNAENWNVSKYNVVAFDTDNTGNYADLPNFNLSSTGIQKIINDNDFAKIELASHCGKSYPAGTKIRLHKSSNTYIYNVAANFLLKNSEWKTFSNFIVCPVAGEKINLMTKLYPATEFVKILILANYGTQSSILEFKNINFSCLDR